MSAFDCLVTTDSDHLVNLPPQYVAPGGPRLCLGSAPVPTVVLDGNTKACLFDLLPPRLTDFHLIIMFSLQVQNYTQLGSS